MTVSFQDIIKSSIPVGPQGQQGYQGHQGNQGAGFQGSSGSQGFQGSSGSIGPQGPAGSGTPAGSNTNIIFNDSGGFGGEDTLTFDKSTDNLNLQGNANIVYSMTVGQVMRVGNFDITSNKFETTTNGELVLDSFASSEYSTVKYIIQLSSTAGIHATEIFCMQDGQAVYATEYATLVSSQTFGQYSVSVGSGTCSLKIDLVNPLNQIVTVHVLRHALRF